jgi:hypothetical protein
MLCYDIPVVDREPSLVGLPLERHGTSFVATADHTVIPYCWDGITRALDNHDGCKEGTKHIVCHCIRKSEEVFAYRYIW